MKICGLFPKDKYPQLYSKRGFEKKRVRFIIPEDRNELVKLVDLKGNRIDLP